MPSTAICTPGTPRFLTVLTKHLVDGGAVVETDAFFLGVIDTSGGRVDDESFDNSDAFCVFF